MKSTKMSGDGGYTQKCHEWFTDVTECKRALLTPSATHALEIAALLINIQPGDEVIMPSYTFVSTANAFALRGAKIIFVDIRPDTMNINELLIECAISEKTKAIVVVHYAGISCEMDIIMEIAGRHKLFVVEDAAQGVGSLYKKKTLGTIGHIAAYSFHETKNITSGGEGGLLLINDQSLVDKAEIIREKGTNRNQFFRGMVDKYTWIDLGSSYLPSELQAAYLWGQIENIPMIMSQRMLSWSHYRDDLSVIEQNEGVTLMTVPPECEHNAHMFYLKCKNLVQRTDLLNHLMAQGIMAVFHYVPLHSAPAGQRFGTFYGNDEFTTLESERLVRLPLYYGLESHDRDRIVSTIIRFFNG
jgi:dTDP-4-amino-4,6-dideoxygalactose transaminase